MIPVVEVYQQSGAQTKAVGIAHFSLRHGEVSTTFSYTPTYLADPSSFAIDPTLPLTASPVHVMGLPGAFRDSAPDRWGRRIVNRRRRDEASASGEALRSLDEVDYLLGASSLTRQGALMYREPERPEFLFPAPDIPPLVQLPRLLAASRDVMRNEAGREEIKELLDAGSGSLGGARPKASVIDEGHLLIAKFSHDADEWDVMAWEKTALDLAKRAGITVPERKLVRIGDQDVLLLKRFDRADGLLKGDRIPYLSAMSLLQAHDGDLRDYAEVGEAMEPIVHNVSAQLEELFRRVVFSIAIHNTDDHLRNTAFLRLTGSWQLSPAFDLNPQPSLERERATSIFGETGALETQGATELAHSFGIQDEQICKIVQDILNAMDSWRLVARSNGCKESEITMFASVFSDRCHALRQAFVIG